MKFGFRTPSLKRRISARLSWKRYVRHSLGFNAPRGWGWLTNPKRAAYNRVYYRTTFGLGDIFKSKRSSAKRPGRGIFGFILVLMLIAYFFSDEKSEKPQQSTITPPKPKALVPAEQGQPKRDLAPQEEISSQTSTPPLDVGGLSKAPEANVESAEEESKIEPKATEGSENRQQENTAVAITE